MSRSQDKLQKVADEISELAVSSCSFIPLTSSFLYLFFSLLSPSPPSLTALHPPEEKYSRDVRIIAVDFSDGPELYPRIAEELQDLDIGVLGKLPSVADQHLLLFKPLIGSAVWLTHFTCCLCV